MAREREPSSHTPRSGLASGNSDGQQALIHIETEDLKSFECERGPHIERKRSLSKTAKGDLALIIRLTVGLAEIAFSTENPNARLSPASPIDHLDRHGFFTTQ